MVEVIWMYSIILPEIMGLPSITAMLLAVFN
jgi:hypothetical protein